MKYVDQIWAQISLQKLNNLRKIVPFRAINQWFETKWIKKFGTIVVTFRHFVMWTQSRRWSLNERPSTHKLTGSSKCIHYWKCNERNGFHAKSMNTIIITLLVFKCTHLKQLLLLFIRLRAWNSKQRFETKNLIELNNYSIKISCDWQWTFKRKLIWTVQELSQCFEGNVVFLAANRG